MVISFELDNAIHFLQAQTEKGCIIFCIEDFGEGF